MDGAATLGGEICFNPAVGGGLAEDFGSCGGVDTSVAEAGEEVEVVEALEVGVDPLE